jgi:ribose transport system permease protein
MTSTHLPPPATEEDVARRSMGSWLKQYTFLFGFALIIVFFATRTTTFLTPTNLLNVLEGSVILLLVALAMTLVVSSGGIDLSVGVALDFGAWFAIVAMLEYGVAWQVAVLLALAGGALVGVINAFLIVGLGVTPFLATLGTFFIGRSAQQIGTGGGANISHRGAPDGFVSLTGGETLGLPNEIIIGLVLLILYYVVMERSTHGKRIHAMGLQNAAARVAGVRTRRYRTIVFMASAITASIGGVILASGLRIYTPNAGFAYLLNAIAAVFIGASMHPRYRPNVPGTLVGVLFLGVVGNGLDLLGLDFNLKAALRGAVLLVALAVAFAVARQSSRSET